LEQRRNNDEATQRELLLVLIRLWAVRAIAQLEKIEEELKLIEYFEASKGQRDEQQPQKAGPGFKTFTIAKSEEQKKVFGLGYPSIPTVTVDEWFDKLQAKNGFGQGPQKNLRIAGRNDEDEDEDDDNEEAEELQRKKQMNQDEWKDNHRRGWGNTYNKG